MTLRVRGGVTPTVTLRPYTEGRRRGVVGPGGGRAARSDRAITALSSGRRMELQRFGYTRTFARYVWAVLSFRGRVGYPDHIRHAPRAATPGD